MTGVVMLTKGCRGEIGGGKRRKGDENDEHQNHISLVAILVAAIRKSMVSCRVDRDDKVVSTLHQMEIGWPTNVRHVAHVTFDRFNGFLGLPVEFEVEIPCRVPSASASVFGVSAESMQCSYDSKGNSVPLILLLMQERLYSQGGLKAEGIFRINPENSQEEHVRDQLNKGIVPDDIDVHCLAGLIKAWFRELPAGVLDGLSPEQVLECNTEEESIELVKLLLPTQAALLSWAVDLMADVVEEEESNKMNARNIAMVFAPNMTQMSDPLTALMHAVQVMNLLKTLILKTLREREETATGGSWPSSPSSDQQTDEDFNSQQEEEDFDSQREDDMSGEEEHTWNDDNVNYSHSSGDEGDSLKDIEESFLRQLEGSEDFVNDDHEKLTVDIGGDHVSPIICSDDRARQLDGSDFIAESGLSFSDSKKGNSSTSESGISFSDSKNGNSSTSEEGEDSGSSVAMGGDLADAKRPLKVCESGRELEMVEARVESLHDLFPCLSPGHAK